MASQQNNRVLRKHLLNSKWTAVEPADRDKHFLVKRVLGAKAEDSENDLVELEAILSKRLHRVSPRELSDVARWRAGWS